MSASISCSVRYSRVRRSAFLPRRGITVRFSMVDVTSLRCGLAIRCEPLFGRLLEQQVFYEQFGERPQEGTSPGQPLAEGHTCAGALHSVAVRAVTAEKGTH